MILRISDEVRRKIAIQRYEQLLNTCEIRFAWLPKSLTDGSVVFLRSYWVSWTSENKELGVLWEHTSVIRPKT